MNKENYKNTFSKVFPSDEIIDKIFDVTVEKSRRRLKHKGLIIVLAVIFTLICGTFTVNAAIDGALFENVKVFIDGHQVDTEDYVKNYKSYKDNKTGENVVSYNIEVSDENDDNEPIVAEYYRRTDDNDDKHHSAYLSFGSIDDSGLKPPYKVIEVKE